jgi:hypothetical protein
VRALLRGLADGLTRELNVGKSTCG